MNTYCLQELNLVPRELPITIYKRLSGGHIGVLEN
ncbi:hypothetical protein I3760_05G077800 [Carya illinoinensis]|nr:hypothetical protein I3760_05G077800 [Carya illinoinensis]